MQATLREDGIYGKAGEVVELGTKKAIELGLFGSRTTIETLTEETDDEVVGEILTEETADEIVVTTKGKK